MAKTLTEIALDAQLADADALEVAAHKSDADDVPLVVSLVRDGGVGEVALVAALSRQTRLPVTDPATVALDTDALRELPREVCRRRRVLPLAIQIHPSGPRTLQLAMADPTDQVAIAEVEHHTGACVHPTVMTLSAVEELIESGYRGFVTEVMKRRRRSPTTTPHHRISDEAELEMRYRALVTLLVDKRIIEESELEEMVRKQLKGRDDEG